jgi:hypothetical protein
MGSDVIALIRENAVNGGTLDIFVDRNGLGLAMTMNRTNSGDASWRLSNLTRNIRADAVYRAVLVYDGANPASAVHTYSPSGQVTGVRFTAS